MASKRVSLKGKGAALFFGDGPLPAADVPPPPARASDALPHDTDLPPDTLVSVSMPPHVPDDPAPPDDLATPSPPPAADPIKSARKRTSERPSERTNERLLTVEPTEITSDRTNERPNERAQVRHSFDIYRDQLIALSQIQTARHLQTGRKPKLGTLVQEALDSYIALHVRTNERTNSRPA